LTSLTCIQGIASKLFVAIYICLADSMSFCWLIIEYLLLTYGFEWKLRNNCQKNPRTVLKKLVLCAQTLNNTHYWHASFSKYLKTKQPFLWWLSLRKQERFFHPFPFCFFLPFSFLNPQSRGSKKYVLINTFWSNITRKSKYLLIMCSLKSFPQFRIVPSKTLKWKNTWSTQVAKTWWKLLFLCLVCAQL